MAELNANEELSWNAGHVEIDEVESAVRRAISKNVEAALEDALSDPHALTLAFDKQTKTINLEFAPPSEWFDCGRWTRRIDIVSALHWATAEYCGNDRLEDIALQLEAVAQLIRERKE